MSAARQILSAEQARERNLALVPAIAGRVVCLFSGDCQATHDQLETWAAC